MMHGILSIKRSQYNQVPSVEGRHNVHSIHVYSIIKYKPGFTNKMAEGVKMLQKLIAVNKSPHTQKIKGSRAVANIPSDVSCTCVDAT
jgi:hypothetical protein